MYPDFPVRGVIPDSEYDRLLGEKAKDKRGNILTVGDKVAYQIASRNERDIQIGEITAIDLFYGREYPQKYGIPPKPDYNIINLYLQIKSEGNKTIARRPVYIVKVV